jgi:hypothetical protein
MNAQVTTSSITGFVKSAKGEPLEGATVTAVHVPSGTKYATISKKDGSYTLPNTRIGGPFTLTVEYIGYAPAVINDITLSLGEPYVADVTLTPKENVLSTVTVTASTSAVAKTGASTIFNSRQIATLPSLTRSVTDFTRLTPQANGNNFAGRDGRFNNLQVDKLSGKIIFYHFKEIEGHKNDFKCEKIVRKDSFFKKEEPLQHIIIMRQISNKSYTYILLAKVIFINRRF